MNLPPPLRFSARAVERAADEWNFNCGPGALCAIAGLAPDQIRPHLGDFERKGYTNPTLMLAALRSLGIKHRTRTLADGDRESFPSFGLARIQWAGPWTNPGVPIAARYRKTHWVGSCLLEKHGTAIFDVNLVSMGGWLDLKQWSEQFVPDLLKDCEPKASGDWWITHAVEVQR